MVLIKYNNVPGNVVVVKLLLKRKKKKNQVNTDKSVFAQILVCWITHADKQMPEYKIGAAVGRVYIDIQTVAAEGKKKKPQKNWLLHSAAPQPCINISNLLKMRICWEDLEVLSEEEEKVDKEKVNQLTFSR